MELNSIPFNHGISLLDRQIDTHIASATFQIELFHEQLPLPVPCYDLVPVTEFTLGHAMRRLRVSPAPLT